MPPLFAVSAMTWLVLGVVAVVVVGFLTRAGWLKLFGPVLFYEVIRSARQGRYFLLRALYAFGLFLLLLWVYGIWSSDHRHREVKPEELATLAQTFFWVYTTVQFFAVILLTPGYVAGCIADDKERRTIEFLLATDLANREIVFGKMVARVGNLLLFLLTGLPVLSLIQFFGGIDPGMLILTASAIALTMLGLVGISMVQTVQRKRVRDAILLTYVIAAGYVVFSWLLWALVEVAVHTRGTLLSDLISHIAPAVDVFRWGDPIRAFVETGNVISTTGLNGPALTKILGEYAAFHVSVFVLGVLYAVLRLRKIALRQAAGGDVGRRRKKKTGRVVKRRPVSAARPMVWKEVHIEGKLKLGVLARVMLDLLVACGFIPLGLLFYFYFIEPNTSYRTGWEEFSHGVNLWVRFMNAALCTIMIIGVAVRAAGSVGGERDKDTLVSLLTTPLSAGEILVGKFWGALASVRRLAYVLALVWIIGLLTGAVFPPALPVQLLAMIPPLCAAAAAGLFYSVASRTTLRALMATLLSLVFALGGHWVVGFMCCYLPVGLLTRASDGLEYVLAYEVGATPPAVFAFTPFQPDDWIFRDNWEAKTAIAVLGHLTWLAIAGAFAMATYERFARMANRIGAPRPQELPGPEVAA